MKRRRRVFELRYSKAKGRWVIVERGVKDSLVTVSADGKHSLGYARWECRRLHADGDLVQLVVKTRAGRIRFEHTYGADPRSRKG